MNESFESVRALAHGQLSLKARLAYVGLLLAASGMTVVILSLWLSESALPARTQAAFGAMVVIGVSWMALAAWVLRTRRPLFARDRVIAGRMAVGFTALFAVGAGIAALLGGGPGAIGALATGVVMLVFAVGALRSAQRRHAALSARREHLERAMAGSRS